MNEERKRLDPMPEELFNRLLQILEIRSPGTPPITRLEEQKLEMLCACYKTDKVFRAFLITTIDLFTLSSIQGKLDLFIDGLLYLKNMILD